MSNKFLWASNFSGVGGSTVGAELAGFIPVFANEIKPEIAEIYKKNHGDHIVVKDVRDLTVRDLIMAIPSERDRKDSNQILVWQTSPPCQDHSVANLNKRKDSDRANIILKTLWQIDIVKPEYILLENVPGFATHDSYLLFKYKLESKGYVIAEYTLNSYDYFFTPQSRKRFYMVAAKDGYKLPTITPHKYKINWLQSIQDLISTLEPLPLTDIQKNIIARSKPKMPFLIQRRGHRQQKPKIRSYDKPMYTLLTNGDSKNLVNLVLNEQYHNVLIFLVNLWVFDQKQYNLKFLLYLLTNLVLVEQKSYNLSFECFARFQGFPDDYKWSNDFKTNMEGLGNSITPNATRFICKAITKLFC